MGRTPRELGSALLADEWGELFELLAVEPWGVYRRDYLSACEQMAALMAQGNTPKFADVLPRWGEQPVAEKKVMTVEEAAAYLAAAGGVRSGG